jgi:hypothetical protein
MITMTCSIFSIPSRGPDGAEEVGGSDGENEGGVVLGEDPFVQATARSAETLAKRRKDRIEALMLNRRPS